ncbi:MAG: glycosyltransferase [Verrucomicrobiota bacterium]|nr:glycosyltransferase [Chthoniobacterales bacterium]MDQ3414214.1 glycosyltransferase [Verrucomicrobiota bacterium]
MKLCDLTQFYSPLSGGVKRYVHEKIGYIQAETEDEHVLIIPGPRTEMIAAERSRIYSIRSPLLSRTSRYRALLNLRAIEEILEREQPHLIESGDPYQVAWKAIASGSALRIPVVGFYHSHFPEAYLRTTARFLGRTATELTMDLARRYVRQVYNRFEATLVPSARLGQVLTAWGVHNVHPVDLGVNTDVFRPQPDDAAATRESLGIPPACRLLLYVGRLAQEKNTQTLFGAFQLLVRREPGRYHLLIVGDGLQRGALQTLQERVGAVTWQPYSTDSEELARFYRAADLLVHPGVQETFGLTALESQACGTPVVGIRGSYMDRIIFGGQKHWASENSAEALADAVAAAAGADDLRAAGQAAAKAVREAYAWPVVFKKLFRLYDEVRMGYHAG